MEAQHYELWARCREFVTELCSDRDASHGLTHMEKVTENAILLLFMQYSSNSNLSLTLSRVILIAMLHDVADHKYDATGVLLPRVQTFLQKELKDNSPEETQLALTAIEAISFSKEKLRGRRWFAAELINNKENNNNNWLLVRDIVSDADKLEALGEEGLRRCLLFTAHTLSAEAGQTWDAALQHRCLEDVKKHFEEKLNLLPTEFIVSEAGKFLAAPRHAAMQKMLQWWELNGVPLPS